MPIDPITWIIICTIVVVEVGIAAVARFWDEIKAWATKVVGYILDAVNSAIEVATPAITELVKVGTRIYKRVEIYVKNIFTGDIIRKFREEEVSPYEVPPELLAQLDQEATNRLKLMYQST